MKLWCGVLDCSWIRDVPAPSAGAMSPMTLADVFGVGVMAARAQQDYAERIEHTLREHHSGHDVADYLRTIEHQHRQLAERADAHARVEQDAFFFRRALIEVADVIGVEPPATHLSTAVLNEWVQSTRAEIMRQRRLSRVGDSSGSDVAGVAMRREP